MKFEALFLEAGGLGLIAAAAYLVTQIATIVPFDRTQSKQFNDIAFVILPVAIYIAYRIYFGICFYITSLVPEKVKYLDGWLSFIFVVTGLGAAGYYPGVTQATYGLIEGYIGDAGQVLWDLSKPELEKGYQFAWKMGTLLVGWFVLLFAIESVLRGILYALMFLLRSMGLLSPPPAAVAAATISGQNSNDSKTSADSADGQSIKATLVE
mmetsp:Transcript_16765/g.28433  ORF Transcript_16765/g.28433 Transcript_16765/m.28433 type:complete len:210 (+) Transcript_16765:33-662(+)